jgi:hypothetical protein
MGDVSLAARSNRPVFVVIAPCVGSDQVGVTRSRAASATRFVSGRGAGAIIRAGPQMHCKA